MKNEKNGFIKRVITSIKDFEKYSEFATEHISVAIKYLIKLVCIFVLVMCAGFIYKFSIIANNGINFIKNDIETISFKDGKLNIDNNRNIELEDEDNIPQIVIIDTSQEEEKIKENTENINNYDTGLLILSDKLILRNGIVNNNVEYKYSDIAQMYDISEFDKQGLINFIQNLNMSKIYISIFFVIFIYMFTIYFASALVDAVTLGVLGIIISRLSRVKIKYKALFNMSVYSLTLPIILNLIYVIINTLTGYTIKYFNFMYTTISYIYLIVAILMIKTDLINTQRELMKIVATQKIVREQLQNEENENKQEEGDKEKQDKEKKKNNEDDEDVGDATLENE